MSHLSFGSMYKCLLLEMTTHMPFLYTNINDYQLELCFTCLKIGKWVVMS